jgi:hypothetical protein
MIGLMAIVAVVHARRSEIEGAWNEFFRDRN